MCSKKTNFKNANLQKLWNFSELKIFKFLSLICLTNLAHHLDNENNRSHEPDHLIEPQL